MHLRDYSMRESIRRYGRTTLTLLGITIGMASIVAVKITISTIHQTYAGVFANASAKPDLEITSASQKGIEENSLGAILQNVEAIQEIRSQVRGLVAAVTEKGPVPVSLFGSTPDRTLKLITGSELKADNEALMEQSLAKSLNIQCGDQFQVLSERAAELKLVGVLKSGLLGEVNSRGIVTNLETAQQVFNFDSRVSCLQIFLKAGCDAESTRSLIERFLPEGWYVKDASAQSAATSDALGATEMGLMFLGVIVIASAVFMCLNSFLLTFNERRKQFAILRTIGATSVQIQKLILAEALLMGIAGSILGCLLGLILAQALIRGMSLVLCLEFPGPYITWTPFIWALLLGPLLSVLAGLLPARLAACRQPLDELKPVDCGTKCSKGYKCCLPIGLLLLAGSIGVRWLISFSSLNGELKSTIFVASLLGTVLAGVCLLPSMIKFVLQMFSHCFAGVEGNLAVQNLIRYRSRTELTAAVLFLSLAIMVTFGQTISDISSDLHQWCSQAIVADYVLRGSKPDNSLSIVTSLPESAEHEIEQLAGVAAVDKLSFIRSQVNGRSVLILARGLPKDGSLPLVIREGNAISAREALQRGEAMLGTALAQDLGLHAGDFIQINTAKGEQRVRVAGTVTEYAVGGMALFMEWDAARSLLEFQGVNAYMISAKSGEAEQLRQSLVRFSGERKYYLEHIGELRSSIEGFLSNVTGVLWCLMVMVFVVASLSVVNTLFMNVRDQSRELGILRAIGLKQCQLKKVIRLQAVLLACTVIVPGIAVGLILSQAIETGGTAKLPSTPEFAIRGWVLIGSSLLALLVAGFAGILPARRAARMPVMAAMQS